MSFFPGDAIREAGAIGEYCSRENIDPVDKAALRFLHMRARVIRSTDIDDLLEIGDTLASEMAQCYPECGIAIARMQKDFSYRQRMHNLYQRAILPTLADDL